MLNETFHMRRDGRIVYDLHAGGGGGGLPAILLLAFRRSFFEQSKLTVLTVTALGFETMRANSRPLEVSVWARLHEDPASRASQTQTRSAYQKR